MVSFMGYGYDACFVFRPLGHELKAEWLRFSSFYVTIILTDTGFVTLTVTEILKKYGGLSYAKVSSYSPIARKCKHN